MPKEGEALKILGSAMVALASSKEEVLEQLKSDIYAKNEVWDFSKVRSSEILRGGVMVLMTNCRSRFTRSSVRLEIRDGMLRNYEVGESGMGLREIGSKNYRTSWLVSQKHATLCREIHCSHVFPPQSCCPGRPCRSTFNESFYQVPTDYATPM